MATKAPRKEPKIEKTFVEENPEVMSYFLNDVFNNYLTAKTHIDTKINWLLGLSGLIMTVTLPYLIKPDLHISYIGVFIISFMSFISFLVSLISLDLPNFFNKKSVEYPNVMFSMKRAADSADSLYQDIKNIKTQDNIFRLYAENIHNLVQRNVAIKNNLFKLARNVLLSGLMLGFICIIIFFFI